MTCRLRYRFLDQDGMLVEEGVGPLAEVVDRVSEFVKGSVAPDNVDVSPIGGLIEIDLENEE